MLNLKLSIQVEDQGLKQAREKMHFEACSGLQGIQELLRWGLWINRF